MIAALSNAPVHTAASSPRRQDVDAARPTALVVGYGSGTPSLVSALEHVGFLAAAATTFAAGLPEVRKTHQDLVLVGDGDGSASPYEFIADLRREGIGGVILFLTSAVEEEYVSRALTAGAHDVVAPPHSVNSIQVRRLVAEERRRHPRTFDHAHPRRQLTVAGLTVDLATREVTDGCEPFALSRKELELLVRLIDARGDVVPREQLLAEIWGNEQESEAVLDATVHRLRKRLEERTDRPDILKTVRGVGYRLQSS